VSVYGQVRITSERVATNTHDISPELKAKAMACKTPEELLALAEEAGIELSDEQLNAVSGGGWRCEGQDWSSGCPHYCTNDSCPAYC